MTLSGGNDYFSIGACDDDCGDVDITVYDESDSVIARDTQACTNGATTIEDSMGAPSRKGGLDPERCGRVVA